MKKTIYRSGEGLGLRALGMLYLCLFAVMPVNAQRGVRKLQVAEMAIKELYVDTVNEDKLVEDAIRGMLEKLDPHSSYTTAEETKKMNESLNGSFDGIGVQFNMVDDTLLVIQPVMKGPSEKAGILAGDRIIAVNDTAIAGVKMSREEIMRRLRGPKGTRVRLDIIRRGIDHKLTFKVVRDKIPVKTLDAFYMISPQVGYIKVSSFGLSTYSEFMEAVQSLKKQGMKDLILDLLDNGGGYLQAAVEMANEFLQKNDLIVYTQGRAAPRQDWMARGDGSLRSGKVIVLVNEFTASAAEIVAGALQDQDRAQVVGRRSFGKGLVQRPINFSDGSMMRLTIAHYYTPSGRNIQKPYVKGKPVDYAMDLNNRFKHGEMYSADSIHMPDSLKFYTLRRHRAVYGGGGIMPDFFVPLDTTQYTTFHSKLVSAGAVVSSSLRYIDKNRAQLRAAYPQFAEFKARFSVPESLINDVLKAGEESKVKPQDDNELQRTLPMLRLQLKALIARDLWDMSEYYSIINQENRIVQKAVMLIK